MQKVSQFVSLTLLAVIFTVVSFQNFALATAEPAANNENNEDTALPSDLLPLSDAATLDLHASATLSPEQVSQPEVIFLYSFALPPDEQSFLGLKGEISLTSEMPVFNESLNTVATNTSGSCPADGTVFPNYAAVYSAYPSLVPLQSFILKNPDRGASKLAVDYTMPVGLPV